MNRSILTAISISLFLTGCQTSGVDATEKAAETMRQLVTGLEEAPPKIDAVSTSLQQIGGEGRDMRLDFDAFSQGVDQLVSHHNTVKGLRENLKKNQAAITESMKERMNAVKDAEMRKTMEENRDELVEKFKGITEIAEETRSEFDPWMSTVLDVRTVLESSLNPAGVKSVKGKVSEISSGGKSINKKITTVVTELRKLSEEIAATKAAKPETEPETEK